MNSTVFANKCIQNKSYRTTTLERSGLLQIVPDIDITMRSKHVRRRFQIASIPPIHRSVLAEISHSIPVTTHSFMDVASFKP